MPWRLSWVYEAYIELGTCRSVGMGGLGPIPWTAIREYAEAKEISDMTRFEYLIRLLEREGDSPRA